MWWPTLVLAVAVLADAAAQGTGPVITDEMKKRLTMIFGQPNATDTDVNLTPTNRFSNETNAGVAGSKSECTTEGGAEGVCVMYYQCDPDTNTLLDDGATLIDIRQQTCPHYLEVCCLPSRVGNRTAPPPPTPAPGGDAGCGWGNPGAQAFRLKDDGSTAEFGEYPWIVAILKKSDAGSAWSQSDFIGGGSIIHPSVVLTGAHKVNNFEASQLKCRAGEWDTQTDQEVYPHQERDVRKIVVHEQFFRPSVHNSIALLFLARPYELAGAPHMGVGCVARGPPPPHSRCQSMGWGKEFNEKDKYAVVLKKVELPTLSRAQCQNALRGTRLGSYFVLHASLTCAGGERGKDTCTGDGGSPLVCPIGDSDGRYAIFGMVAWGIGCGAEGVPGVYVDVPHFYDWIGQKMAAEGLSTDSYKY